MVVPASKGDAALEAAADLAFMRRALFHAARGLGRTTPNPMVGAVVVDATGVVVGHGWHTRAGEPHAEVNALGDAGGQARGGTLYVTLEPCSHTGRTGPCTERIIGAGVRRVVAAMRDPDERVSGRGFDTLRAHGIIVDVGLFEAEAAALNAPFLSVKTRTRPLIIVKAATSINGRIGVAGARTKLSSPEADRKSQQLRASVDAILVGSNTVLVDDPVLTVRDCRRIRPFVRVVLDRRLRVSRRARLFSTLDEGPIIILTSEASAASAKNAVVALEAAGATVRAVRDLHHAVGALLEWDVSSLLVEGGACTHAAFWDAGLVDRVHLIVSPVMLNDAAIPLFGGAVVPRSALQLTTVEPRGSDIWIEADVYRHH